MRSLSTIAVAPLLSALMLCLDAQPAAACTPAYPPKLEVPGFIKGTPDANGLLDGKPNENRARVGEPLLFAACDETLCGYEVTLELEDETTLDHPVTLEHVSPGQFHRIVPVQPLQPGMYTLSVTGTRDTDTLVRTYVFRVEPAAEPSVPEPVAEVTQSWGAMPTGTHFVCLENRSSSCLGPDVNTQRHPYVVVSATFEAPASAEHQRAFLVRLLPAADAPPTAGTPWSNLDYLETSLSLEFRAPVPEYCGVIQTLRVSDGTVVTRTPTCFTVDQQLLSPFPATFETCRMADRTAYARAWCADNRSACSQDHPPFIGPDVLASECVPYADLCGAFVGRRADDQGVCGP